MDVDFDAAAKRFSKDQASRKEALAAKREQLAALQRRFPGYSRVALRHLLGSRFEAMGFVYALVERRRAARG